MARRHDMGKGILPPVFLFFLFAGSLSIPYTLAAEGSRATLPLISVDTGYRENPGSRVIRVDRGESLQQALDAAAPGDVIELVPGAIYRGPFSLPEKTGSGWIVIRSGDGSRGLPGPGTRISPQHAPHMAKLVSSSGAVVVTAPGAHHYRFVGIEIYPDYAISPWQRIKNAVAEKIGRFAETGTTTNLVVLAGRSHTLDGIPHHIVFDRCYLHGDTETGTRRGIAMNSAYTAVVDSWLSGFRAQGRDSQAIAGWNGPGPYKIVNNYLEGAGENVMFGGGDPTVHGLVPADIEIKGNHFAKPLSWKAGTPDYEGTEWTVKNLLELKNAERVLVDGNLFENSWPQAQNGFAILFTVRNQDGGAPWSVVQDVTFTNNVIRGVVAGINILGRDDIHASRTTRNIDICNNLFELMIGSPGGGRLIQLLDGIENLSVDGNSAFNIAQGFYSEGKPHTNVTITDNLLLHRNDGSGSRLMNFKGIIPRNLEQPEVGNNLAVMAPVVRYPAFATPGDALLREAGIDLRPAGLDHDGTAIPGLNPGELCRAMSVTDLPAFCNGEDRGEPVF